VIGLTKLSPGAGNVALAERPEPAPGPGQVVVEVVGAGICGTDLHIADGEYETVTPVTMGHEVSGVVAEVGAGVEASWRWARVASETYFATCGRCEHYLAGRINLCPERRSIGTHVDGAFAARVVVPGRNLRVDLESLVTEIVPLEEWERAFAATRAAERIKFVLAPT